MPTVPVGEQVSGSAADPVGEQVSGSAADPAGEQVSGSAADPAGEQVSGSAGDPAGEQVSGSAADPFDVQIASAATGLLAEFNQAGILDAADVQVATRFGALFGESHEEVLLAAGLTVRALRHGSVCISLDAVTALNPGVNWPEAGQWRAAVEGSPLAADHGPLQLDRGLLYLDRYWRAELQVGTHVLARDRRPPPIIDPERVRESLAVLFPDREHAQQLAALVAAHRWLTVLGGGPGTGKTSLVARLLALLTALSEHHLRIALAAPTGKAAARLQATVAGSAVSVGPSAEFSAGAAHRPAGLPPLGATTVHRLLGRSSDGRNGFRFHNGNRLPYDVVVVDEASMVALSLMAGLLDALRPEARLILVGDPDQLASVEAGAVLADIIDGLSARPVDLASTAVEKILAGVVPDGVSVGARGWQHGVVLLRRNWRFSGGIAEFAAAIRDGDPAVAVELLQRSGAGGSTAEHEISGAAPGSGKGLSWNTGGLQEDVVGATSALREAAEAGDAMTALSRLDRHRVLCAHRTGPAGVQGWDRQITRWLAQQGVTSIGEWYVGRPLLVTANDSALGLNNGDTGVVVREPDGSMIAAFRRDESIFLIRPSRLVDVLTMHAMTVHRSQGSQFEGVTVILPPVDSPLLTREMFYTAVTRARQHLRVVGGEDQVRQAISRRAVRASGLRDRLRDG